MLAPASPESQTGDSGSRWLPSWACLTTIGVALALLAYNAYLVLITDIYRNIVPGIWLTLGQDLAEGLFYRPLIGEAGYGGTRYFPLHFVTIAAFMRAGAGPMGAGMLAITLAVMILASGLYLTLMRLGVPRTQALLFTVCGITPYFV